MEEANSTYFQQTVNHAANWTFADDFTLLQWLKHISQNLQSRVHQTKSNLNKLSHNVNSTNVALDNVTNALTALQFGKQFVEHRVQDDDDVPAAFTEDKQESVAISDKSNTKTPESELNDFLSNNIEALRAFSKKNLTPNPDQSDSEEDNDLSYFELVNPYNERPLPYIIYSKEWNDDMHVGISPKKRNNQTDIDVSDTYSKSSINSNGDSSGNDFFAEDKSPSGSQNQHDDDDNYTKVSSENFVKSELQHSVSDLQKDENIFKTTHSSTNSLFPDETNDNPRTKSPITVSNIKIRPTNLFDDNDFQSFIDELNDKVQPKKSNDNTTKEIAQDPPPLAKPSKEVDIFANNSQKSTTKPLPILSLFDEDNDNDDDFFKSLTKNVKENDSSSSKIAIRTETGSSKTSNNEPSSHKLPNSSRENTQLELPFADISIADSNVRKAHEIITKLLQDKEISDRVEQKHPPSIILPSESQTEMKPESRVPEQTKEVLVLKAEDKEASEGSKFTIQADEVPENDPSTENPNKDSNESYNYKLMENNFQIFSNEPPDDNDFFDSMDKSREGTKSYLVENEPFYEYDSLSQHFDIPTNQPNSANPQLIQGNTQYSNNIFYDDVDETLKALNPIAASAALNANYYSVNNEPPTIEDKYSTSSSRPGRTSPSTLDNFKAGLEAHISRQADAIQTATLDLDTTTTDIFADNINRTYILPNVNKNRVRPSALRKPPTKRLLKSQAESNSDNQTDLPIILEQVQNVEDKTTNSDANKQKVTIIEEPSTVISTKTKANNHDNNYHPLMQSDDDPIPINLSTKLIAAFDSDDSDDFDDLFPKKPT